MSRRFTHRQIIPNPVIENAVRLANRSLRSPSTSVGLDTTAIAVVGARARRNDTISIIVAPLVVALLWLAVAASPVLLG